jgi:hypothetical protein
MFAEEHTMPLRDHFRPPVSKKSSWRGFHAMWPTVIVQQLRNKLPPAYIAEPRVTTSGNGNGGVATEVWTAAPPVVAVETERPDEYEYEVRIFDMECERRLVAAIELVSPANKDRPETRESFVCKCAALLRKGVAVTVVDLVTTRHFNLYAQMMAFVGHPDPTMVPDKPWIYAASCRWVSDGARARLEAWSNTLVVGQPLPTLPLWLGVDRVIPLDLEGGYEQACHDLWIE